MKKIRICLDELLEKREITRYEVQKLSGIKYQIIDNYYKNKVGRYDSGTLLGICLAIDCTVGDLLQIRDEEPQQDPESEEGTS